MLNRCWCSSYSTHDEVCINVSCEFNSTECDIFSTYFDKNKLEVIRRLTSWLVFCQDYEGSTSRREGGYFINNGVYRSAAGLTRLFDLSNFWLGGINFRLHYINGWRLFRYGMLIFYISTSPCSCYYCQDKYFYDCGII